MFEQFMATWPQIYFIIQGTSVTLQYSLTGVFFGFIIGTFLALLKVSKNIWFRLFAEVYTSFFRGTPLLIQLTIIYYGLPVLTGIKFDVFVAGAISFSLNSGAYVSEVIRAGINSVDKGQYEAAIVLGISKNIRMRDIILPQAIRTILPSLVNELINLVKESALISVVGGMDLMRRAQVVSADTYDFFTPMLIAAASYYILIMIISFLGKLLEKRLAI
jgi:polar amino acid transport system permease protein